jgi:ribosome-binding protein aMBF1 (putative translation factor)
MRIFRSLFKIEGDYTAGKTKVPAWLPMRVLLTVCRLKSIIPIECNQANQRILVELEEEMPKRGERGYELRKILAENIRAIRHQRRLSQEGLAEICGLHRTYVGSVERAERNVTLSTLQALATALGISVPDLLTKGGSRCEQEE